MRDPRRQDLLIDRHSVTLIKDLFKFLKRGELDIRKIPDITFKGEEGIDAHGLTKEFLSIVMSLLQEGKGGYIIFEGAMDHLLPVICEEFQQSSFFKYVGQLIGMSVLHGGGGLVGLSRALAMYIASEDIPTASAHLTIEDVPDYSSQEALQEVHNSQL